MNYDTSLISWPELVTLTGVQDLENLAAGGELSLDAFVKEAHREVYRRLEAGGIDPTLLTNEARLKSAVAYSAIVRLALAGYVAVDAGVAALWQEKANQEIRDFRPATSESDSPRHALEGLPAVANFDDGWVFGPSVTPAGDPKWWGTVPRQR